MIICAICGRETPECFVERHHLIPVSKKGKHKETAKVCVDCGDQVHQLFSNKELAKSYNTIELIRSNERVQKWIKWIRKRQEFGTVCMRRKK